VLWSQTTGVASYGYYVDSRIPGLQSRLVLKRGSGEDFVQDVLSLGWQYRSKAENPRPCVITAEDEEDFERSERCYLCGTERTLETPLIKEHNHFTGCYRGPACQSCNVRAQNPKRLVCFFHKLTGFDSHELIRAIV
jgi:hypothetical protein